MAKTMAKRIEELLNEEKWTRATLNSYSIANFKELDELIDGLKDREARDAAKDACDEHLEHTKNSIIALYVSGIISLSRQLVDDSNLIILINIFTDNHKWKVVEYLCERILSFGENKYALRTLAECYENENEEDKKVDVWKRLIKVDYEEADIVRHLAEIAEQEEDSEAAVDYYKKAIHRYINKKQFSNVKDIWLKLLEHAPEELDLYFHLEKKIAKTISGERAAQLLEDLYETYKELAKWDHSIAILKRILEYDPLNHRARTEIVNCYKEKFKDHSQLEEYIRLSNLTQSWRNVHEAIADFEKHISFDEGNFVGHRSWGIGRIRSIKDDTVVIDFTRKRAHEMSLKMAVNALQSLAKDHIWVLKAVIPKDKLKERIKKDIPWGLATLIRSFDNAASMKQIKAEIVPSILTAGEWSSWSTEARRILKTDPGFGNVPDQIDVYEVRETPISFEEKTFNRFRAETNFFGKVETILEFLKHADPESEYFSEMFQYFVNFIKVYNQVDSVIVSSYLLIQRIIKDYPFLNPGVAIEFPELLEENQDIEGLYSGIEDGELAKLFIQEVRKLPEWEELYVRLLPVAMSKSMVDELDTEKRHDSLSSFVIRVVDGYKEMREPFIWLARTFDKEWFARWDVSWEKILIGMVHLLDITYREIENRRDVSANRKLNRQINAHLFKDDNVNIFITDADEDSITRLFTLLSDVKELDPSQKQELRKQIVAKFPNFRFYGDAEAELVSAIRGLWATKESYQRKQKELQHLIEVEVPKNAKEIGAAIELGDLSENAEYKAGKERQEMLNISIGKLKEDLERVQIFKPEDVDTSRVGFGTTVDLKNLDSKKKETYTILGPWESEPAKNIISYQSPFGGQLWGHVKGDTLSFVINEREYNFEITGISAAEVAKV